MHSQDQNIICALLKTISMHIMSFDLVRTFPQCCKMEWSGSISGGSCSIGSMQILSFSSNLLSFLEWWEMIGQWWSSPLSILSMFQLNTQINSWDTLFWKFCKHIAYFDLDQISPQCYKWSSRVAVVVVVVVVLVAYKYCLFDCIPEFPIQSFTEFSKLIYSVIPVLHTFDNP